MRFTNSLNRGLKARRNQALALLVSISQFAGYAIAQKIDCLANPRVRERPDRVSGVNAGESVDSLDSSWETDSRKIIKLRDLNGSVVIVGMFYSTCEGVCTITVHKMLELEASLSPRTREKVKFALVTLDARHDTAKALRAYRRSESLATSRWILLRGDDKSTGQLAALLGVASGRDPSGRFLHSSVLTVLDKSGRIVSRHSGLQVDLNSMIDEIEVAAAGKK